MVGAVLAQNTSWKNVEKALANLRHADLLDLHALGKVSLDELEELIRPAGYYRLKARRLQNLIAMIVDRYGSLDAMFGTDLSGLREELLSVSGIGPETADSILLYAGGLPSFVVDAYTARIMFRHGWIDAEADYHTIKEFFESQLPDDVQMFKEYHALLVAAGKDYCLKSAPRCDRCPLASMLPEGGPIQPGE
jgi:endonuclease-3 related protein